jgi:hypothetical protein
MNFRERCKIAAESLPESDYRKQLEKLHDEMLDSIDGLQAACDSLQADVYTLTDSDT